MSSRDQFQLYLLTKMSAVDRVARARAALGASEAEMQRAAAALGWLDQVVRPAAALDRLIGPPISEDVLGADRTSGTFVGSIRHAYVLPLWPDVEFVVYQHPQGYAWGEQFEQPPDRSPPADLRAIEPWRWARNRLAAAARFEIVEEWSYDCEARLYFPNGAVFRARFDYGLLQTWTEEP
jgi:hypothetical protein